MTRIGRVRGGAPAGGGIQLLGATLIRSDAMTTADPELPDLIRRLREQDPSAAAELIRRYEPDIRRIARVRLARFGLRHLVDSEDIAQSVLGRFFARAQAGDLTFDSPD